MPPDTTLATLSDDLTNAATAIYLFAALAFAAVLAYRRTRETAKTEAPAVRSVERVLVGVGAGFTEVPAEPPPARVEEPPQRTGMFNADSLSKYALGLTIVGWLVQMAALTTRGLAADRPPWANMYEFVCAVVFAAVTALLVLFTRYRAYYLGVFVMFPAVLGLGMATTALYTPVSALQPSLQSY